MFWSVVTGATPTRMQHPAPLRALRIWTDHSHMASLGIGVSPRTVLMSFVVRVAFTIVAMRLSAPETLYRLG